MITFDAVHRMFDSLAIPVDPRIHENLEPSKHLLCVLDETSNYAIARIVDAITAPEFPCAKWVEVHGVVVDDIIWDGAMVQARIEADPTKKIARNLYLVHATTILGLHKKASQVQVCSILYSV